MHIFIYLLLNVFLYTCVIFIHIYKIPYTTYYFLYPYTTTTITTTTISVFVYIYIYTTPELAIPPTIIN